jgi:sporulation protein YabP
MALEEKTMISKSIPAPKGQNQSHKCSMINREAIALTGVKDVLSFDVSEVLLETALGMLSIRGSELHVNRLTLEKGEVDIAGKIDSLTYSDVGTYKKQGESFLGRLFR